ncbi:NAD-dependent epimerase/dehydratase family protein [Alicyclobacillus herbarius]|uniref:NAD-dependent epimerase/dehydratase family protein n=1 Tax=Alicyclobacillus herbarius TaxID=122960 RepID=UPI00041FDF4E|nr:NAD-dependent epimerase/dehydratase family protein [Alicyclobacillus herbarius]
MSVAVVTGCAGFIGSHLCERLLDMGYEVVGIDAFTGNYERWIKQRNLAHVAAHPGFTLIEQNLRTLDWDPFIRRADVVFHQAALPGVRTSWGRSFADYVKDNVLVTQLLLDAVKNIAPALRPSIVYASSSSVYGEMSGPLGEGAPTRPLSPYGVTKLAAEHLCRVYASAFAVPVVSLRYFTVFGPRQRPDMAIHRFILSVLLQRPLTIYGDGQQMRDFTFVSDVIDANLAAVEAGQPGDVFNIGGGNRASVNDVIACIEDCCSLTAARTYLPSQPGDPAHTFADIGTAGRVLKYHPRVTLAEGIARQVADLRRLYGL